MSGDCPWVNLDYRPAEFCEESLCSWIRQPGNVWTNVGFLIAAFVILRSARRNGYQHLQGLAWIALVTGLGSAFFHASETLVGRLFDYAGMYSGAAYMLAVNVRRWLRPRRRTVRAVFWAAVVAPLSAILVDDRYALALYVLIGTFCCVGLETYLYFRQRKTGEQVRYTWLAGYWLVFLIGYFFWWLDKSRVLCNPDNHWISGHGVWHLLDALALYLVYLFYRQFDVLRFQEEQNR